MVKEFELKSIKPIQIKNIQEYTGSVSFTYEIRTELSSSEDTIRLLGDKTEFRTSNINFGKSPNYGLQYQVINSGGRTNNNKYFVKKLGNISLSSASVGGSSLFFDTEKEDRLIQKTFFVNKFAAPGGPETNAELFLNAFGGEYSVYNSMNYRNLLVRRNLDDWWSERYSLDADIPSYHKINDNIAYDINKNYVFNGQSSADDKFTDDIFYDNAFIQHPIPRSDKNYSWINSSLQKEFLFEPQIRALIENTQYFGTGISYKILLLDQQNLCVLYFSDENIRFTYYKIEQIGRSKSLKFSKSVFFNNINGPNSAPMVTLLPKKIDNKYYVLLSVFSGRTEVAQSLYTVVIEIDIDSNIINVSPSYINTGLTANVDNNSGYTYSTPKTFYKYDVQALSDTHVIYATCNAGGDAGKVVVGEIDYNTLNVTINSGDIIDIAPSSFPASSVTFRPVRIFPKTSTSFVISLTDNQNITSTTLGKEYYYAFTRSGTTLSRSSTVITQNIYFNNSEYRFLTRDASNNIYYSFIADIYPQAFANSSSLFVGVLKIDSNLTASRIFSQSIGTSSYFSAQSLNKFINIYNNNLTGTYSYNNVASSNTKFDVMYMYNSNSSSYLSTNLEIATIDISTPSLTINDKKILYNGNIQYGDLIIIPKDSERTGSFDAFLTYQSPNTENRYVEHVSVVRKKLFNYYVNEEEFNSNLEKLWKKQLFKNYSKYYDNNPEFLDYYYFNYKNQLLDPVVEFCGTNISTIKNFDETTNTISLSNNLSYINLREYISNLNGFYGYSSWKQIHNHNNFYNLKTKRKNIFVYDTEQFIEPFATFHKPLEVNVRTLLYSENLPIFYTDKFNHLSNHISFVNGDLLKKIDNNEKFYTLNKDDNFENVKRRYVKYKTSQYNYVNYTEKLFPKNKYTSLTRTRDIYNNDNNDLNILLINKFWNKEPILRSKTLNYSENNLGYIHKNIINDNSNNLKLRTVAQNSIISSSATTVSIKILPGFLLKTNNSIWSLDNTFIYQDNSYNLLEYINEYEGKPSYLTENSSITEEEITVDISSVNVSSAYYPLELETTRIIGDLAYPGYLEERKITYKIPKNLFGIKSTPRTQYIFNPFSYTDVYEPFGLIYRPQNTWYNTYEEYGQEIRLNGKDYSILAEYNISEHIEKYIEEGVDYLNKSFLSIKGSTLSSSVAQDATEDYSYLYNSSPNFEFNKAQSKYKDIVYYDANNDRQNNNSLRYIKRFSKSDGTFTLNYSKIGDVTFSDDGTKLYFVAMNTAGGIFYYNLATPWNISGATFVDNLDTSGINAGTENPHGIRWSPSGKSIYILTQGPGYSDIYRWNRSSSPYTIDTINVTIPSGHLDLYTLLGSSVKPRAFDLSSDGKYYFFIGLTNQTIYTLEAQTPFLLTNSTLSNTRNISSLIGSTTATFEGMHFSKDGKRLYLVSNNEKALYEFYLSTAYDINTAVLAYKKNAFLSEIISGVDPIIFGLYVAGTSCFIADYNNNALFHYENDIDTKDILISENIDLQKFSQAQDKYSLPGNYNLISTDYDKELDIPTSLIFDGEDKNLSIDITNINNILSSSYNITSPNLITSSFGTSIWFKLDKEIIENKKPVGLFTYINKDDKNIYDPLSLGIILNTSASLIGGYRINTDIVLYNGGSHDNGSISETNSNFLKYNILKYYHHTSSINESLDYIKPNIILDDQWHHLFLQVFRSNQPGNDSNLRIFQRKYEIFPRTGLDYGYYNTAFTSITSSFSDVKSTLLRSEDYNYKIGVINVYGDNVDASDDKTLNKYYGISLYNMRGDKFSLLDYKQFTSSMTNFITSSTNNFHKKNFVDIKSLGTNNDITYFIAPYAYLGTSSNGIFINYEYIFGKYTNGQLSCSSPKILDSYKINYNISSSIYSFNVLPIEYNFMFGRCDRIIIDQTYHSGSGNNAVSSSLFAYKIDYTNETLTSKLAVTSTKSSSISNTFDTTRICSLEIAKAQQIGETIRPDKSFIASWYETGSQSNTKFYLFTSGSGVFTSTLLGSSSNTNNREKAILKYAYKDNNIENYILETNQYNSNQVKYKVTALNASNVWTTGTTYTVNDSIDASNTFNLNDLYIFNNILITVTGSDDTRFSTYHINTSSLTLTYYEQGKQYYSKSRFYGINFPYELNKLQGYNYLYSSSFNVPYLQFNNSVYEKNISTIKFNYDSDDTILKTKLFLDGIEKYSLNYQTESISFTNNDIIENPIYYNKDYPFPEEFNLNRLIVGKSVNRQFSEKIQNFKGEIDELTLWQGVYNTNSVGLIYNSGTVFNPIETDYIFHSESSKYYNSNDYPDFNNVSGNLYGWYRLGYPKNKKKKDITKSLYDINFIEKYTESDLLKQIKNGNKVTTHYERIDNYFNNSYKKISLTVNGITKLLPYNGFYPSQRAAQIGKLFIDSVAEYKHLIEDGKEKTITLNTSDQYRSGITGESFTQAFLQPFMSPGILFNSIKSGIAVDWPLFLDTTPDGTREVIFTQANAGGDPNAPGSLNFGVDDGWLAPERKVFVENTLSIFDKPNFYKEPTEGISLNRDGIKYVISVINSTGELEADNDVKRLPFEALVNLNKLEIDENQALHYQNPTIYSYSSSLEKISNLNNTSSFVLTDIYPYFKWNGKKRNSLYELAMNNFIAEVPRFFLKNSKLTSYSSKPNKDIKTAKSGTLYVMDISLEKESGFDIIIPGSNKAKGKYFGPPTNYINEAISASINDPAYAPFTPPYFYGKRNLRIEYLADKSNPTINEIISKMVLKETDISGFALNHTASTAFIYRMPLTASININKTKYDPGITIKQSFRPGYEEISQNYDFTDIIPSYDENTRWIISTKWECPAINFNDKNTFNYPLSNKISLKNTSLQKFKGTKNQNGIVEIPPIAGTGLWSGFSENFKSGIKMSLSTPKILNSRKTSSLADLVGFEQTEKYIGQLADKKEISEAIVMIPYYEKTSDRDTSENFDLETPITDRYEFIKIEKSDFKKAYDIINASTNKPKSILELFSEKNFNSIRDMIVKMDKYEIPPHLDFLTKAKENNFTNYDPFAMYLFEFKRTLDKKDLGYIWQGVMPSIGKESKKDSVTIEHKIGEGELIKEIKYPKYLKWLIFKVKKKAEKYYDNLTEYNDERFSLLKTEEQLSNLGYNWPYDYFSLVETANAEVTFKMLNKEFNKEDGTIMTVDLPTVEIYGRPDVSFIEPLSNINNSNTFSVDNLNNGQKPNNINFKSINIPNVYDNATRKNTFKDINLPFNENENNYFKF